MERWRERQRKGGGGGRDGRRNREEGTEREYGCVRYTVSKVLLNCVFVPTMFNAENN